MKKTLKIKLILNLVFLFCISSSLLSQWAITTKDGVIGTDDYLLKVDANCEYQACFTTYIYSPELPPFIQSSGFNGDDNGYIPPMFLRINILNFDQTFQLTDWEIEDNARYINTDEIVDVVGLYKSTICVDIDLSGQCLTTIQSEDDPIDPDPSSTVLVSAFKELLMSDGEGGFIPYPICLYRYPNSMFSCEIFGHTEPFCYEPEAACLDSLLYHKGSSLLLACEDCILNNQGNGKGNFSSGNELGGKRNSLQSDIIVSPNPFTDNIFIEIPGNKEFTEIQIFDNLGQKIKSITTEKSQLSIITNDLNTGIYYLLIQNDKIIETMKILKQ